MENRQLTVRQRFATTYAKTVFTRADLVAAGVSPRAITAAVHEGTLLRLRRDRYARTAVDGDIAEAVRISGRVTCLTLLRAMGVFVLTCTALHVHVRPGVSRTQAPRASTTVLHWDNWSGEDVSLHAVALRDAVRHAIRCQAPRAALATLDSVLHHRLMSLAQLTEVFDDLPARFHALLALVDPSAESGPETFMRLILRALGLRFETQVTIPGVGRVDFVVEGWLIIECDSKEYHEGWDKQIEDRARDLAAAGLGYVTVRPLATDIMHHAATVRDAIAAVLQGLGPRMRPRSVRKATRRRVHNSSELRVKTALTARNRVERSFSDEL